MAHRRNGAPDGLRSDDLLLYEEGGDGAARRHKSGRSVSRQVAVLSWPTSSATIATERATSARMMAKRVRRQVPFRESGARRRRGGGGARLARRYDVEARYRAQGSVLSALRAAQPPGDLRALRLGLPLRGHKGLKSAMTGGGGSGGRGGGGLRGGCSLWDSNPVQVVAVLCQAVRAVITAAPDSSRRLDRRRARLPPNSDLVAQAAADPTCARASAGWPAIRRRWSSARATRRLADGRQGLPQSQSGDGGTPFFEWTLARLFLDVDDDVYPRELDGAAARSRSALSKIFEKLDIAAATPGRAHHRQGRQGQVEAAALMEKPPRNDRATGAARHDAPPCSRRQDWSPCRRTRPRGDVARPSAPTSTSDGVNGGPFWARRATARWRCSISTSASASGAARSPGHV